MTFLLCLATVFYWEWNIVLISNKSWNSKFNNRIKSTDFILKWILANLQPANSILVQWRLAVGYCHLQLMLLSETWASLPWHKPCFCLMQTPTVMFVIYWCFIIFFKTANMVFGSFQCALSLWPYCCANSNVWQISCPWKQPQWSLIVLLHPRSFFSFVAVPAVRQSLRERNGTEETKTVVSFLHGHEILFHWT